jgi:hypothetical protein
MSTSAEPGVAQIRSTIEERPAWTGGIGLAAGAIVVTLALVFAGMMVIGIGVESDNGALGALAVVLIILAVLVASGLGMISPGHTRVVQFFGQYIGTVRHTGLVYTVPLTTRRNVSVRVRNFETSELKVNDAEGNPVNIAAIVVWQVADTAKARFGVEDFEDFIRVQSEAALRHVARSHPYDDPDDGETSLRGATEVISNEIEEQVAERVAVAGIQVIEARISNLAYAPEIAQAMLQRQQAGAIIAARARIVEGAVTMVEDALTRLEEHSVVELDNERRVAMVSNLLVVLCGESRPTPVVNAGSLYT